MSANFAIFIFYKVELRDTPHMTIYGAQVDQKGTGNGSEVDRKMTGSGPEVECEGFTSTERLHPAIFS